MLCCAPDSFTTGLSMNTNAQTVLTVSNIAKSYTSYKKKPGFLPSLKSLFYRESVEVKALKPLSFNIHAGEFVGVLGPNGAGKTTTLKILTGLVVPSSGKALAFGQYDTSKSTPDYLRQLGMVMGQRQQLLSDLPASDSFALAQALYEIPGPLFEERVAFYTELLDVGDKVDIPVRKLSLGERMKLELIQALLHQPKILFLDEPTIGLDFEAARKIRNFLLRLNQEFHTTILLTSHYMYEVEELCDRIAVVNHGQIIALDTPAALKAQSSGDCVIVLQTPNGEQSLQGKLKSMQKYLSRVHTSGETLSLYTKTPSKILNELTPLLEQNIITNIEVRNSTLEDVYVDIIKNKAA